MTLLAMYQIQHQPTEAKKKGKRPSRGKTVTTGADAIALLKRTQRPGQKPPKALALLANSHGPRTPVGGKHGG